MSFFKGLSKVVKKNVNFKTLVKVAGKAASFIPVAGDSVSGVIGGLQAAHEAKKANRQAEADAQVSQAAALAGGTAGSIAGKFITQTASNAYRTAGEEIKSGSGQVGAQIVDSTLKEWFKKHKTKIFVALGSVLGLILIIKMWRNKGGARRIQYGRK